MCVRVCADRRDAQVLYFESQPFIASLHAMRRSRQGGKAFTLSHVILACACVFLGAGLQLSLTGVEEDSQRPVLWLIGGALETCLVAIGVIRMSHRGWRSELGCRRATDQRFRLQRCKTRMALAKAMKEMQHRRHHRHHNRRHVAAAEAAHTAISPTSTTSPTSLTSPTPLLTGTKRHDGGNSTGVAAATTGTDTSSHGAKGGVHAGVGHHHIDTAPAHHHIDIEPAGHRIGVGGHGAADRIDLGLGGNRVQISTSAFQNTVPVDQDVCVDIDAAPSHRIDVDVEKCRVEPGTVAVSDAVRGWGLQLVLMRLKHDQVYRRRWLWALRVVVSWLVIAWTAIVDANADVITPLYYLIGLVVIMLGIHGLDYPDIVNYSDEVHFAST